MEKRKDYAFRRQFNEKPSVVPGCPGPISVHMQNTGDLVILVMLDLSTKPDITSIGSTDVNSSLDSKVAECSALLQGCALTAATRMPIANCRLSKCSSYRGCTNLCPPGSVGCLSEAAPPAVCSADA